MISMSKSKQLNLFDEVLELNHLSEKQPTGFLDLFSAELFSSMVPKIIDICESFKDQNH